MALVLGMVLIADVSCMKCGESIAKKATEKALEGAVNAATGGKASIDVSGNVDVSGLPAFLQYPGAKAVAKWSISGQDGTGSVYSFETADPKENMANWFKTSLAGQGWKEGATMESGEGTMLMYGSPDEKQFTTVMAGTEEGKTTVAVTYGTK
jgi:hypothetical protein